MTDIQFPLSCKTSDETVSDHFADVSKMIGVNVILAI